ncbi:MAG: hypothetical protein AB1898_28720 [Acidobacteriota bacterium]
MKRTASTRRSPIHEALEQLQPRWTQVSGMDVPLGFQSLEAERALQKSLALCDLSCLPKLGLKGPGLLAATEAMGIAMPDSLYGCLSQDHGGWIIRVDQQEVLIEDGPDDRLVPSLEERMSAPLPGVYPVRRQEASFLLSGEKSNLVLRETCGVDFSQPVQAAVMTRVAGVSAMVLPVKPDGIGGFRFWLDASYAAYLWEALIEIVRDHGGEAIGLAAVYSLLEQ